MALKHVDIESNPILSSWLFLFVIADPSPTPGDPLRKSGCSFATRHPSPCVWEAPLPPRVLLAAGQLPRPVHHPRAQVASRDTHGSDLLPANPKVQSIKRGSPFFIILFEVKATERSWRKALKPVNHWKINEHRLKKN